MDILDLNKKEGTYGHGLRQIFVKKTPFTESNFFDLFTHSFIRKRSFNVFKIKYQYEMTVFTNTKFYTNNVENFKVIFSKYCPATPLVFGIGTIDGNTDYYLWREFSGKGSVYLHNYEPIKSGDLLSNLTKENLEVNSETFQISSKNLYLDIIVYPQDFEVDFRNLTHKSYKTYSFLHLNATLKCNFENYNSSFFNSTKLDALSVYFHKTDTENYYPLLLEFRPKHNFDTVYYKLTGIDSKLNYQKVKNITRLNRDQLAMCLNETYVKLHGKFNPKPNDTLLSYYDSNTLPVTPPFEDEISSVSYLKVNLFATFGSLFAVGGIVYSFYQFYVKMKPKYY